MNQLPPPTGLPVGDETGTAPTGGILRRVGRAYLRWPLWAKVGVPGAVVVFTAVAGVTGENAQNAAAERPAETSAVLIGANQLADTPVSTEPSPPTAPAPTDPPTTPAPTDPPTTPAPTDPPTTPPTTPAPTDPPTTPPTTPAPTDPPTTPAPTPAPTQPPATQPPPPPPTVAVAAAALDPDYGTCKEAKAHGAGPYYRGQDPEYAWYRDADSDGIVCE